METVNKQPWKEVAQYVIAGLVITYSFIWLFLLLFKLIPLENKDVINILSGQVVVAGYLLILNWMFGSSKSSGEKDATISKALGDKTTNENDASASNNAQIIEAKTEQIKAEKLPDQSGTKVV